MKIKSIKLSAKTPNVTLGKYIYIKQINQGDIQCNIIQYTRDFPFSFWQRVYEIIGGNPQKWTVQSNSHCTASSPKNWLTDESDVFLMHENFKLVNCFYLDHGKQRTDINKTRLLSWVNESDDYEFTNIPRTIGHVEGNQTADKVNGQLNSIHFHLTTNLKFGNDLTRRQASISPPTSKQTDQSPMLWFGSEKLTKKLFRSENVPDQRYTDCVVQIAVSKWRSPYNDFYRSFHETSCCP